MIIITLLLLIIIMTIFIICLIIIITIIFIASLDFFLLITSQALHILSIISALGYWCFNNALLSEELIRNVSIFLKHNMSSQQLLLIVLPRCTFISYIMIVMVEMLRYLMSYINKYYENIGADRCVENIRDDNRSDSLGSSSASSSSGNRLQQQQTSNNDDDHDDGIDVNEDYHDHKYDDKDDVVDINDVDHKDHHDDRSGEEKKDKGELDVGEDRFSFKMSAFVLECLLKILSSVASTVMLLLRPYNAMIFVTIMMHGVM